MNTAKKYFTKTDEKLLGSLLGRILIAVENKGRAWYVDPVTRSKYYLGSYINAYSVMRLMGVGMATSDLKKIHIAFLDEVVKDIPVKGDTLATRLDRALGVGWQANLNNTKEDLALQRRFTGRMLIQVQTNGEAWYVDPVSKKRYYLGRPAEAYAIMRAFGLGITNKDLNKIPVGSFTPSQIKKIEDIISGKIK